MRAVLSEVTFRYPGAAEPALADVSLELGDHGITVVTGALGAGASTLLLVVSGLAPEVTGGDLSGRVRTLDVDPASKAGRATLAGRVGFLLPTPWTQLSGMSFTVWEEVAFGPANLGWSRDRIGEAVERALARFGVAHLAERNPQTLSGGELQRVMFAATTATEPELMLLDEPVQELDAPSAAHVFAELLPQLAERAAIVVATTEVDRILDAAGRVLVLDGGRLVEDGRPHDVLTLPRVVERGRSSSVATIAHAAGLDAPYPLTVDAAVGRLEP